MDVVDIALQVTEALERCGIGYFLGGSLASSFQGEPRATNDVDLVVDLQEGQVEALVAALGSDFDIDDVALRRAAAERSSWNVIYLPSATKIDLFILRASSFDRSEFARRRRVEVRAGRALIDHRYLDEWGVELGVGDLLVRAGIEAGEWTAMSPP